LNEKYPQLITDSSADLEQVKIIKEKMCMVAQDFDAELKSATEHSSIEKIYKLPGDKPLHLKEERIKCTELLFQPGIFAGKDIDGIHKFTHDAIIKCDNDIRRDLFKNIVLAGGCTMFYGMKDRMKKEIQALAPSPMGPEVEAPADRKYSCWLGGAILSLIDKFDPMWITKKEYDEYGKGVVHRKCF
jgi:actin